MEKNSRERYCDRGQRKENPDRAKNQSDCRIRYRARLEKKSRNLFYWKTFQEIQILKLSTKNKGKIERSAFNLQQVLSAITCTLNVQPRLFK